CDGALFETDALIRSIRRYPQSHSSLLQSSVRLADAKFIIHRIEFCDGAVLLNGATKIDGDFRHSAGYLETQHDLLIRCKSTGDYSSLFDVLLVCHGSLDAARLFGSTIRTFLGI